VDVEVDLIEARFRAPFLAAWGSVPARELLVLTLRAADGHIGHGEAAPLPGYDGVTMADVQAALEDCRALLNDVDADEHEHASLLEACRQRAVLPQALAAIDLALWDLAGKRAKRPVWRLLGAAEAPPVEVNWTVGATDRAGAAAETARARQDGFGALKVKVGVGDDAGRLAAVRAVAGRDTAIRVDANGAWSPEEALAALSTLQPIGLELCEEPCTGLDAIAEVAASTRTPVAIDETAAHPGAFDTRMCEAACLKIARSGGISGLVSTAARARAVGYQVYVASTLDGPLGIAAALHAAAAISPDRPCGLATLELFEGRQDLLLAHAGHMHVPAGSGLGDGLLEWYGLDR
jgi:o-succinylbenzoate synthase